MENENKVNKINILNIVDSNRSSVDNSINGLIKYLVEQKDNIHSNLILKNYLEKKESSILDKSTFQYFAIYYSQKPISNLLDKNIFLHTTSSQTNYSHESENYSLKSKYIDSSLKNNENIPNDDNNHSYISFIQWNHENNDYKCPYVNINAMDVSIQFMDSDFYIYDWNINLDCFNNSNSSTIDFIKDYNDKLLGDINNSEYDEPELFMRPSIAYWNELNEEIFEENKIDENIEYIESKMLLGLDINDENNNSIEYNNEKHKQNVDENEETDCEKCYSHQYSNNESDNNTDHADLVMINNNKLRKQESNYSIKINGSMSASTTSTVYNNKNYNSCESYNEQDNSSISRIGPSAPIPTPNSSIIIPFSEKENNETEEHQCIKSKSQDNTSMGNQCTENKENQVDLSILQSHKDELFKDIWKKVNII